MWVQYYFNLYLWVLTSFLENKNSKIVIKVKGTFPFKLLNCNSFEKFLSKQNQCYVCTYILAQDMQQHQDLSSWSLAQADPEIVCAPSSQWFQALFQKWMHHQSNRALLVCLVLCIFYARHRHDAPGAETKAMSKRSIEGKAQRSSRQITCIARPMFPPWDGTKTSLLKDTM